MIVAILLDAVTNNISETIVRAVFSEAGAEDHDLITTIFIDTIMNIFMESSKLPWRRASSMQALR